MSTNSYTLSRLDEQIEFYDTKSQSNQKKYKTIKFCEILLGGLVTAGAGFGWSNILIGCFGLLIIVFEGIKNAFQYHYHWLSYRSTCEYLRKEKHFFNAKAGPYSDVENIDKELAERIEEIISQEHAKWLKENHKTKKKSAT